MGVWYDWDMYKIAVLDYRLLPEAQKQIQAFATNRIVFYSDRCPESERIHRTGDADIALVTPWEKIDSDYLNACPNLKYLGLCGTSTANVDLEALKKRGITFSNIVSGDKDPVAEFFFMELVRLARGLGEYQWKSGEEHELAGKYIGIIGLGAVGKSIANLALAYKMHVSYTGPHHKVDWEEKSVTYKDLDELLGVSEIVFICTPSNVTVLDTEKFKKMRLGTILVQASGGTPFELTAFKDWVSQEGNFAIFDMSAGVHNHELYKDLPHVIFSEAVAGVTHESNQRRGKRIVENLQSFLNT